MKTLKSMCAAALCGAILLGTSSVWAAEVKTYQVTGPVLEVTPTMLVVQKGKERWELALDPKVKLPPEVKVGAKVTITYKMVAQDVQVKEKAKK